MNNKTRQEILKELKFILDEGVFTKDTEEEAQTGVAGGYFSKDYKDIIDNIRASQTKTVAGISFLDLTSMGSSIDEGELSKLIKTFGNISSRDDLDDNTASGLAELCRKKVILVDEVGTKDVYFYVKCKKIASQKGASLQSGTSFSVPFSTFRLGYEGDEETFKIKLSQLEGGETPSPSPQPSPTPSPTPSPSAGATGSPEAVLSKNGTMRCPSDISLIVVYQQWLKYVKGAKNLVADGAYGKLSHSAAQKVFGDNVGFQDAVKQDSKTFCAWLASNKSKWATEIKNAAPNVNVGVPESGGGKSRGNVSATSKQPAQSLADIDNVIMQAEKLMSKQGYTPEYAGAYSSSAKFKQMIDKKAATGTLDAAWIIKNTPLKDGKVDLTSLKESKNYYDNKKLNEAKQLFNKLLKNL